MSIRFMRWPVLGVFAMGLVAIAALTISAGQHRAGPLATLERPATPVTGASVIVHSGGYRVALVLSPNGPSTANWLSVKLSRHG